jgi:hypothetical protein
VTLGSKGRGRSSSVYIWLVHVVQGWKGLVLVLIDESGDPGFRISQGSTSHFVVAMVIFNDLKEAERASLGIAALREKLRVKPEFKFSKSRDDIRDDFFASVVEYRFRVRAIVIDKAAVQSPHLRTVTESFYNYFLRMLLQHDGGATQGARIKIDGSGDAEFKKELNSYLRQQLRDGQIGKFTFADSRSDNLIQLADMCSGAILRAHRNDLRKNNTWLQVLKSAGRVDDIWNFR